MRKLALTVVVLALAALAAPLPASAAAPVKARLAACHAAADQAQRYAVFAGEMRGARKERMEMRFDLERKAPGEAWATVDAPGLGVWNRALEGVTRYRYRKKVENLSGPARYRALVSYRWTDAAGTVKRTATRRTAPCVQADFRPDLRIDSIRATRTGNGQAAYVAEVRNAGLGGSAPSQALVLVDGVAQDPVAVPALGAKSTTSVRLTGPACAPGGLVEVRVDSANTIDEGDETNDARSVPCPLS